MFYIYLFIYYFSLLKPDLQKDGDFLKSFKHMLTILKLEVSLNTGCCLTGFSKSYT